MPHPTGLAVLVVGDTVVDTEATVDVVGLGPEDPKATTLHWTPCPERLLNLGMTKLMVTVRAFPVLVRLATR
jgi:hypothetical protein